MVASPQAHVAASSSASCSLINCSSISENFFACITCPYADMLRSYRDEIARLETHNEQLRAQMDLIEYNIARLPINAEELYRPMPKPDRSVAHSGRRTKRA